MTLYIGHRACVIWSFLLFFFFKQKTAYEMRISDWSSDVCSSDLDAVELASLLDDGVEALRGCGVDVLWPRSLQGALTSDAVLDASSAKERARGPTQEEPLLDGIFGTDGLFAFQRRLSFKGDPLTEETSGQMARRTRQNHH